MRFVKLKHRAWGVMRCEERKTEQYVLRNGRLCYSSINLTLRLVLKRGESRRFGPNGRCPPKCLHDGPVARTRFQDSHIGPLSLRYSFYKQSIPNTTLCCGDDHCFKVLLAKKNPPNLSLLFLLMLLRTWKFDFC